MRRMMATAASVSKGSMKSGMERAGAMGRNNKAPSLSPSPPLHQTRRVAGCSGSQSDSGITAGVRDLSLRPRNSTQSKQPDRRRLFSTNAKPPIIRSLTDVATLLKENHAKNVVIVAGAGISTPSGIPDFRTPGTGLYDNLQQYNVPYPEAIFDIDFFHHNPRPFFALAKELYPSGKYRPNYIHYFARLLNDRGMLLRVYTQNIDGLERLAGVPPDKMVEAHGTFSTASCVVCQTKYRGSEIKENIFEEKLPKCKVRGCPGIIKPDIVFFGEELPKRFYFYLKDMLQADLVLVMGTSLEVQPFAGIIDTVRWTVPRVLFNRNAVGPFKRGKRAKDFISEGDLIECLQNFAHSAGMKEEMEDLITQCEGTFRLAAPPPPEAKKPIKVDPKFKMSPAVAAMWRQNASANLYSDSDTSDSSDYGDSESVSSSSSGKKPAIRRTLPNNKPLRPRNPPNKPNNSRINASSNISKERNSGPLNSRPPSGKNAAVRNRNNSNSSGSVRTFTSSSSNSSLLSKRKDNSRTVTPQSSRKIGNSSVRPQPIPTKDNSWTGNGVRRKMPIDVGLKPSSLRPPQTPGSHAQKPRSSSVNKAMPPRLESGPGVGGYRSIVNRVRSAKPPPRLVYQQKAPVKTKSNFDVRTLAFNVSNSSSSDDDEVSREDDDDSSSDDSR